MMWKTRKTTRRSFVAAALLTAFAVPQLPVVAAAAAPVPALAPGAPGQTGTGTPDRLPAPTGKEPVGTKTLHLVDASRPDPWKPAAGKRELMVTLWYPARHEGDRNAPYMSKQLSKAWLGKEDLAGMRTNSTVGARPAGKPRPLVVLSPGFGMSRASLTGLGEDLASRGYAVAAVDHTYEAPVEFPGGRIESCEICRKYDLFPEVVRNRSKDIRFLLDQLTGPRSPLAVDARRIAVAGHSIGGASAVQALQDDPRVDAAANFDGDFPMEPAGALNKPVLLLGAQRSGNADHIGNWDRTWKQLTGWKRWLDVPEGGHMTFTDAPWLADRFGLPDGTPPDDVKKGYGTLHGPRSAALTRAYVGAFLDRHLRGTPSPLLDRPSPAYPEVTFLQK
ncbi:dienelactone hydrolase family protein [Streptomyces roseoverticillatus]|uniref:alpha/beta hydrolase family protein n=1 Tax=Streptomyces roseoverticillatus TaxID=66429 RepID=UPI0034087F17